MLEFLAQAAPPLDPSSLPVAFQGAAVILLGVAVTILAKAQHTQEKAVQVLSSMETTQARFAEVVQDLRAEVSELRDEVREVREIQRDLRSGPSSSPSGNPPAE